MGGGEQSFACNHTSCRCLSYLVKTATIPVHFPLKCVSMWIFQQHTHSTQQQFKRKEFRHTHDIAHSIHANASAIIYGAEICFSNLYLISFLVQYVWENSKVKANEKNQVKKGRMAENLFVKQLFDNNILSNEPKWNPFIKLRSRNFQNLNISNGIVNCSVWKKNTSESEIFEVNIVAEFFYQLYCMNCQKYGYTMCNGYWLSIA